MVVSVQKMRNQKKDCAWTSTEWCILYGWLHLSGKKQFMICREPGCRFHLGITVSFFDRSSLQATEVIIHPQENTETQFWEVAKLTCYKPVTRDAEVLYHISSTSTLSSMQLNLFDFFAKQDQSVHFTTQNITFNKLPPMDISGGW